MFWVDAICINQSDVTGKNQQISIMPFIYMRAKTVLVSLGLLDENARTILQKSIRFGKRVSLRKESSCLTSRDYWKLCAIIRTRGESGSYEKLGL